MKRYIKNMHGKIKNLLKSKDFIYFVVCFLFLAVFLLVQTFLKKQSGDVSGGIADFIEVDMLVSVVLAFLLTSLADTISRIFVDKYEDNTKLTDDYDGLIKMYQENTEMLLCRNSKCKNEKKGRRTSCKREISSLPGDTYKLPIGDVILLRGRDVVIHDEPANKYAPPPFCKKHYTELLGAHDSSETYNQTTLRVCGISESNNQVTIRFSRSTYFDAMVSNRAIDFKIGKLCVRDLYAYGPFLTSLEDSLLSNHLGFNGMVETSDGKLIFVKRHKRVSIGKNTMQCSVAASLKAKYALNKDGLLTKEGIARAIMQEIEDELALADLSEYAKKKADFFKSFSFENNVLYFYRDLLEGGKPQLMFYATVPFLFSEIQAVYQKKERRNRKEDCEHILIKDGNTIRCVDKKELKDIYLAPDEIVIGNRGERAMPSAVATVLLLKQAMAHGLTCPNVKEAFTLSKKGDQTSNEDALYVDKRFVAVVDGVTSKAERPEKATMSSGRFAAQTLCDLLACMPETIMDPEEVLTYLNEGLKERIEASDFNESSDKPMASIILYDHCSKCIISYGDCQALLAGCRYRSEKHIDRALAEKRADVLQAELEKGVSPEVLRCNDSGRAAIKDALMQYAAEYANKSEGGFPVLGRGKIVSEYIVTHSVNVGETVVLASDGYPELLDSLKDSEEKLEEIIKRDPLLIKEYKATKGVYEGNVSYDDRTYIRFAAW